MRAETLRNIRSILIGFLGATAVSGILIIGQHHFEKIPDDAGHISVEWNLNTRMHVRAAHRASTPCKRRVEELQQALATLVNSNTDIRTKSADWLAGYADLLRQLGLSLVAADRIDEALDPLIAASSIPVGTKSLMVNADTALYRITQNEKYLSAALAVVSTSEPHQTPPESIDPESAPPFLEAAALLVRRKDYASALNAYLRLHKALSVSDKKDVWCTRATAAGFTAQLLWKLGAYDDAKAWLRTSEREAVAGSNACRSTRKTILALIAKAQEVESKKS